MAVNAAFHTSNFSSITTERNLYANLVTEAIQIYGHDIHYIDRTIISEDTTFGEDTLSMFRQSAKIEMYVENAEGGYQGEKELMSKFGLQNLSEITFVVSKNRFQELTKQLTIEDGTDTTGGSILIESGTIDNLDNAVVFEGSDFYLLNETDATDSDRPLEGDLVFHPIMKKLFQVNFVDHDQPFHQLDNNPVYKLQCRTFDYSSERLDTGISDIDAIEEALSVDTLNYQFTLEESTSGETLLLETEHWLIQEDYIVGDGVIDKTSQNELFDRLDDTVLDFTESNPFGDAGSLG